MYTTFDDLKIIAITNTFYNSVIRNNLNLIDIVDFSKIRKHYSINDIAELLALNNILSDDNSVCSGLVTLPIIYCNDSIRYNIDSDDKSDLMNSVLPLSKTEEIVSNIYNKLQSTYDSSYNVYEIIVLQDTIYVILKDGFFAFMQDSVNKLEFTRAYLKECYKLQPIYKVSMLPIYRQYMTLLSNETNK